MILWTDFILDEVFGPLLVFFAEDRKCRKAQLVELGIMEDAGGAMETFQNVSIQETRQEQRPARMVGFSSLELTDAGKEASQMIPALSRQREKG